MVTSMAKTDNLSFTSLLTMTITPRPIASSKAPPPKKSYHPKTNIVRKYGSPHKIPVPSGERVIFNVVTYSMSLLAVLASTWMEHSARNGPIHHRVDLDMCI